MDEAKSKNTVDVSVVIPCYQEEKHLLKSVAEIHLLLSQSRYSFEMIFVEDCSTDKTRDMIVSACRQYPNSKYIFHGSNTGRGGAFLDGAAVSAGTYVGYLDIDLEVSCAYLIQVLSELDQGSDVVIIRRHYSLYPSPIFLLKHLLSSGYKILVSTYLGLPKMDTESGFKFFRKTSLDKLAGRIQNKRWFFDTEVMALAYWSGMKIKEVDGLFLRKKEKVSTVHLFPDTMEYFSEIIKFKKRMSKEKIHLK